MSRLVLKPASDSNLRHRQTIKQYYESLFEVLDKNYREERDRLYFSWKAEQEKCKHKNTDWEPDPSGNNDSTHWCRDCGKTGSSIYNNKNGGKK